jgi:hypothetical protein
MSISKTFTAAGEAVDDGATLGETAIVVYEGDFQGDVWIELKAPNSVGYVKVQETQSNKPKVFTLNNPDTSLLYRFAGRVVKGSLAAYMGP